MTFGVVTVINKDNAIVAATYSNGSYLSGLGLKLMKEYQTGTDTIKKWIKKFNKEYPENKKEVKGIERSYYRKSPNASWYYEYGYEYSEKTDTITVYYNGDLLIKINRSNISYWMSVAENEDNLYKVLMRNPDTMQVNYDMKKLFSLLKKMEKEGKTADKITELVGSNPIAFEISSCKSLDCWHREDRPGYDYTVEMYNIGRITFIISNSFGSKWDVTIQLPFIRTTIIANQSCEKNCLKALVSIISNNVERFKNFVLYFDKYEDYFNKVKEAKTLEEINEAIKAGKEGLKNLYLHNPWYIVPGKTNSVDDSIDEMRFNARYYIKKIKENKEGSNT